MPQAERLARRTRGRSWRATLLHALRHRSFPVALATGALLLFSWPFVRIPPLPLAQAWVHLLAAWLLVIVALFALAWALGTPRNEDEDAG